MKYLLPAFGFILSMTIGYLRVGVILLTTRIPWDPDYIKRSTDLAKSRPNGGVLLCELGMCKSCTTRARDSKCQSYPFACWKWETQQIDSRKLRLTRNQRKIFWLWREWQPTFSGSPSQISRRYQFWIIIIFLGHFPILLPCKNTELAHAAVIQLALV